MGAPVGNNNAAKAKKWTAAIERALEKRSLKSQLDALEELAEVLLNKVGEGDVTAIKELGDRLEGKPGQALTIGGDQDAPLVINWKQDA